MAINFHLSQLLVVSHRVLCWDLYYPVFTMFVNEIPSIVSSPVLMFADDTKIFRVIRNIEVLQKDLDLLQIWSAQWQLKFNVSKCKHLYFSPAHNNGTYCLNRISIDIIATPVLLLMTNLNSMIIPLKLPSKLIE